MTNKAKNNVGRPKDAAKQALGEEFDVSPRRVRQLVARYGLDKIQDAKELNLMAQQALVALRTVRIEKETLALDVERRTLITHAEARESGMRIAEIFNRMCSEAITNWPVELAGKDEIGVRTALVRSFAEFTTELHEELEKI